MIQSTNYTQASTIKWLDVIMTYFNTDEVSFFKLYNRVRGKGYRGHRKQFLIDIERLVHDRLITKSTTWPIILYKL